MDNSSVHESRWESKLDSHYRCWKPQVFTLSVFVSTKAWACDQGSNNQMYLSQILIWELEVPRSREILSWWWAVATMLSEPLDTLLRLRRPSSVPGQQWRFLPLVLSHRLPWSWLLPAPHVLEQAFFTNFLVVSRAIPRLLNKRLICLTQPKVLCLFFFWIIFIFIMFFSFLQPRTLTDMVPTVDKQSLWSCGRPGLGLCNLHLCAIYIRCQSRPYCANVISSPLLCLLLEIPSYLYLSSPTPVKEKIK